MEKDVLFFKKTEGFGRRIVCATVREFIFRHNETCEQADTFLLFVYFRLWLTMPEPN